MESDPALASAVTRGLVPFGVALVSLAEGERALDRARSQRPDLVVAAAGLSDMSGFSLCNRLRRLPGLSDLPIVLIPGPGDAAAIEAHRQGKTPATDYLPPGASAEEVIRRVGELIELAGLSNLPEGEVLPDGDEPLALELADEETSAGAFAAAADEHLFAPFATSRPLGRGSSGVGEREIAESEAADELRGPPHKAHLPPPLPASSSALGAAVRRTSRPDPFADLANEPRLPLGASPEEKVSFFRDRLKAREELLGKVREVYQATRDDLQAAERELGGVRKEADDLRRGRDVAEAQLATARQELTRLHEAVGLLQGQVAQASGESAAVRLDAEERAQSLSELLNATMREREEDGRRWGNKLGDAERKVGLLQEEVEHLAAEVEERGGELAEARTAAEQLQAALSQARDSAVAGRAVLTEQLAQRAAEIEALRHDLAAQQAALGVREAELSTDGQRLAALEQELRDVRATQQTAEEVAEAERQELELRLGELDAQREQLEGRAADAEAKQAELRGELEAVHELQAQSEQAATAAEVLTAKLEAELASRTEEAAGLRRTLESRLAQLRLELEGETERQVSELRSALQAREEALRELEANAALQQTEAQASSEQQLVEAAGRVESAAGAQRAAELRAQTAEQRAQEAEGRLQRVAFDAEERVRQAEEGLQQAERRARAGAAEVADSQTRVQAAEQRAKSAEAAAAQLAIGRQKAEAEAEGARQALAAAEASAAPAATTSAPGGVSAEKALRVRLSDLTTELQSLRTKLAQPAAGREPEAAAELSRLREELEAQRAENDFLTAELERAQGGQDDSPGPSAAVPALRRRT